MSERFRRHRVVALLVILALGFSGSAQAQRIFGVAWVEGEGVSGSILEFDSGGGFREVVPIPVLPFALPPVYIAGGLAFDDTSLFYGYTEDLGDGVASAIAELDPDTGALLDEDTISPGEAAIGGLGALNGLLYVSLLTESGFSDSLLVFDPATDMLLPPLNVGAANPGIGGIVSVGGAQQRGTLAAAVLNEAGDQVGLFEIDPFTGAASAIVDFAPVTGLILGLGAVGEEIYVSGVSDYGGPFFGIIDFSGNTLDGGTAPFSISDLAAGGHVIPEPATMALLGLGLAALSRRRKK